MNSLPSVAANASPLRPRNNRHPLPNRDLDTGRVVQPGGYPLTDSTYADLLHEARSQIREVTPQDVDALPAGDATVIDVREASEWEQGHLPGAVHISKSYVEQQIEGAVPDRAAPVVLYCAGGVRSLFAAQTLQQLGYTNVASMSGGFQAWKSAGLPWEAPVILSSEQKQRYSRHLLIPEVGAAGQARLLESKALFIGAGGLGSPAALYLGPPASARSGSSTSTSSTCRICSGRSCTRTIGSGSARSSRRRRRSTP